MLLNRTVISSMAVALACSVPFCAFSQTPDAEDSQPPASRDELLAQARRPEVNTLGTMVMMLYVIVNCRELDERDAAVLINAQLKKLKGIDPRVQVAAIASAKLQAKATMTRQDCARLDRQDIFRIKQAVRKEKMRDEAKQPQSQSGQPSAKQNSYADIYYNEVRRREYLTNSHGKFVLYISLSDVA